MSLLEAESHSDLPFRWALLGVRALQKVVEVVLSYLRLHSRDMADPLQFLPNRRPILLPEVALTLACAFRLTASLPDGFTACLPDGSIEPPRVLV